MRLQHCRFKRVERHGELGLSVNKFLKNAALASGSLNPVRVNSPSQYINRQRQYFDPETRAFTAKVARYSSDFVEAQVQGIDGDNPEAWGTYRLRFTDVVRPSSAIQRHFDDYKMVLFESPKVEYIQPGTKIVTMGSTWLAVNPVNISGSSGSGLVRRCNAVWNHLDYYGNVISEPIVVENFRANANDSDTQQSMFITKGYFNVIAQYNDFTRQIDTNTRMILGTAAYRVTGYADFETEFTGDYNSLRLLYFTIRYEEPNHAIDDMVHHVAGGKTFSWDIFINGPTTMSVGKTVQFLAMSERNNADLAGIGVTDRTLMTPSTWSAEEPLLETADDASVCGTTLTSSEPVITYLWESSDETVLTVNERGFVTALAEGEAFITATLEQNPEIMTEIAVTVTETQDGVEFITSPPATLSYAESVTLTAAYFEDGEETAEELVWMLTGADESAYTAVSDGNSITITCYGYSASALVITACYASSSASAEIQLEGI